MLGKLKRAWCYFANHHFYMVEQPRSGHHWYCRRCDFDYPFGNLDDLWDKLGLK